MDKTRNRTLRFVRAFLSRPVTTGSLVPSSRFLAKRMLRAIAWDQVRVMVELGPGTGSLTGFILSHMQPSSTLIAIDSNPEFVALLRKAYPDSRLRVVHGSALELRRELQRAGLSAVDYVVCGLPFANMKAAERIAILRACRNALTPEGTLSLFQYRRLLLPDLRKIFGSVKKDYEVRNFPPAHVFHCAVRAASYETPGASPLPAPCIERTEAELWR